MSEPHASPWPAALNPSYELGGLARGGALGSDLFAITREYSKSTANAEEGAAKGLVLSVPAETLVRQVRRCLRWTSRSRACRERRPRDLVHLSGQHQTPGENAVRKGRGDGPSHRRIRR